MTSGVNAPKQGRKIVPVDVETYLKKLRLKKERPTLDFLKKIHKAHLTHIPYENLDFFYHKKIELSIQKLFSKIILSRRGGVGYELNGLIHSLLLNLGFKCYFLSVRPKLDSIWAPDFEHMAILVLLNQEQWLVDVGFGDLFIEPKKLISGQIQVDYNTFFKFEKDQDDHWVLHRSKDLSRWDQVYKFSDEAKEFIEFMPRCQWHQENPESRLTQEKVISQLFDDGRVKLTSSKLQLNYRGSLEEFPILNEDEFFAKLNHHFRIPSENIR